jgi:hypothetical protein
LKGAQCLLKEFTVDVRKKKKDPVGREESARSRAQRPTATVTCVSGLLESQLRHTFVTAL